MSGPAELPTDAGLFGPVDRPDLRRVRALGEARHAPTLFDAGQPGDLPGQSVAFDVPPEVMYEDPHGYGCPCLECALRAEGGS